MTLKIIFMGTPDFAVPALKALNDHYEIVTVVTQPDKPKGRGRKTQPSPVKTLALAENLPILQPKTLRDADVQAQLAALSPDLIVVAAFGQILPETVLNLPPHGCINIHASQLPRWRGAAPIAAAIRAGDAEAGVTLMKMDEGLDTGDIIRVKTIPIEAHHTRATLTDALSILGADLLIETLPDWLSGKITSQKQDNTLATFAPRLKKAEGHIDWQQSAIEIERHIRAFSPQPGTFSLWGDTRVKILAAQVDAAGKAHAGEIVQNGKVIAVGTGDGLLTLTEIQPAGKRAMRALDFARGAKDFIGSRLN